MTTYYEPTSIADAVGLLASEAAGAGVVAGGTDIVVAHRTGKQPLPGSLVAIHRVAEMRGITERSDGGLTLGGIVTHAEIESSAVLRSSYTAIPDAASLIGSPATRHVGTIGGNLCNASPAMELGGPLLVFGASVGLASSQGARTITLEEFLTGPGVSALADGELLTDITLPAPPDGPVGSAYLRLEYRRAMEIAVVGATALVALGQDGRVSRARVALTAVAPTCIRVPAAEVALSGQIPDDTSYAEAGRLAAAAAMPIGDVRASAEYRRAMVAVLVARALEVAVHRAEGEPLSVPANRMFEG